ncbi:helix-turn-helix domain-containing protein [Paracoccus yeei]|uniref:Helix-turn-helix domain-containing protein n=1 Tax=Paracoccus yeei TaxID=147645 RepID=A0A2D2C4B9_9RHOB|nr:helix-turn-helix domain-containing protein [Paracoccus yeei]ATQ57345.1 helix-turn-helix domain-containing protein [Paracoccus yeei]AYF01484.1 helix-turn-helix domain-containing protein [Paracoccus yeei]
MIGLRGTPPLQHDGQADLPPGFDDPDIRLGDVMRGERATLGKSLLDVQRELRIRASYVAAIENCDISVFDAPSFVAGYVRSYARYLGMDPEWTFRRFCHESGFQPTTGMAPVPGIKPLRRAADPAEALANPHPIFLPKPESLWSGVEPRAIGSVLVMVLLACGLGYGGWSVLQEVQKVNLMPGDQAPGAIAALDPVQEAAVPETVESAQVNLPRPEGVDGSYRPEALEVPVLVARDGPIAAIDPGLKSPAMQPETAIAQATEAATRPIQTAAAGQAFGPPMPQAPALQAALPQAQGIQILAARPAWVRVSSADGTVLLEKTMDAGERFTLPALEQPPLLRTGNSGAVYFAVNGRTYGPAAPGARVVKNIELSANALTSQYAFADPAKDPELAQMIALAAAEPAGNGSAQE